MNIRGVHHIALKVDDLSAMTAFYADVLGLREIERQQTEGGEDRSVWFDCGGVVLMLESLIVDEKGKSLDYGMRSKNEIGGWHLISLEIKVSDRQSWKKRLESRGVKVESESLYSLYFFDPEGNRLALSHYPEAVSQEYQRE